MTGFRKSRYLTPALAALTVVAAVAARILSNAGILSMELGLLRTVLYIILYLAWGISVRMRVIQPTVRRYLAAVSALIVFWFVVRTMKYLFAYDIFIRRWLWYSYYIPMLMIPLLALFISMSLGKPENYRLGGWAALLTLPTVVFTMIVLTNDLHRLIFTFPDGVEWSDENGKYAACYYFAIGWVIVCALAAFVIMVIKCRRSERRKYIPVLWLAVTVIYALIYVTGAEWLVFIAGDLTAFLCLMIAAIFESCIYSGLIQTNTDYGSLFEACTLGMQIAEDNPRSHPGTHAAEKPDPEFSRIVRYASSQARPLTQEIMESAEKAPVLLDKNTFVKSGSIEGGHVYWQEDITEMTAVLEELEENRQQLSERNYLAQENYNTTLRLCSLREKNRLYDILQKQTAPQISLLDELFMQYDRETDEGQRRRLLAMTAVVGAYIKRYGNLLFISEKNECVELGELARCVGESFANLEMLGAEYGCGLSHDETVLTRDVIRAYRTFECVTETAMNSLCSMWLRSRPCPGHVAVYLEVECGADLSGLSGLADGFSCEDGIYRFTLRLRKGGEQA